MAPAVSASIAKNIEQALTDESPSAQDEAFRALVDRATHLPPAFYSRGKHWRGNSEEERRDNSRNNRPSQFRYSLTAADVERLERETLLTGDVIDRGSGTYHAFKKFDDSIGYDNGDEAYWLRAELSGGTIHSHPRRRRG